MSVCYSKYEICASNPSLVAVVRNMPFRGVACIDAVCDVGLT